MNSDVMTPDQRSRCMSRIRNRDTGPEVQLRRALWSAGLRYRLRERLPGKPDLVFRKAKLAVFVDGCFWHCCPVHHVTPKNNPQFWAEKFRSNVQRDQTVANDLRRMGWRVLRLWEHEVRDDLKSALLRVELELARHPDGA